MKETGFPMLAKTLFGLEDVLAAEIIALGGKSVKVLKRAVSFEGDKRLLYRANLELRTALRLLVPVATFEASSEADLYRLARKIDWEKFLNLDQTFAIDAVAYSESFRHSQYAALKVKDAIVDRFRHQSGQRPSINTRTPHLRIHLHITQNQCTISLDSSGRSLNQRGYRLEGGAAPLNEVLAAGMILLTGWKGDTHFLDPMCGSGTLPIEAALIATNRPPQVNPATLGFLRWNDFDRELWEDIQAQNARDQRKPNITIMGSDQNSRAVSVARANVEAAQLEDCVVIKKSSMENVLPPPSPAIMVTNPPYDERMELEDAGAYYRQIGDLLKKQFSGYQAWIISGSTEGIKRLGLKPFKRIALVNGKLACKYHGYDLYAGSRKGKQGD